MVSAVRKVSAEYIGELVDKYGNMLLRIAFSYLKSKADAEDAVQDVFLQVVEKEPAFNDENHEKAWLIRTVINICKNNLGRFWNKNRVSIDDIAEIAETDSYSTDNEVLAAVMALPEKYRVAVHMYYYEGYSTSEIASLTGSNEPTVRSLLCRARKKLKDELKEDYDFE